MGCFLCGNCHWRGLVVSFDWDENAEFVLNTWEYVLLRNEAMNKINDSIRDLFCNCSFKVKFSLSGEVTNFKHSFIRPEVNTGVFSSVSCKIRCSKCEFPFVFETMNKSNKLYWWARQLQFPCKTVTARKPTVPELWYCMHVMFLAGKRGCVMLVKMSLAGDIFSCFMYCYSTIQILFWEFLTSISS